MSGGLEKLTDAQLQELKAANGDLTKLSDATLMALKGAQGRNLSPARRLAEVAAQGPVDAAANFLGGPVDLVNLGLKQVGLGSDNPIGGSGTFKDIFNYTASLPQRAGDAYNQGSFGPLTAGGYDARVNPETFTEKALYGATKGAGDAVGMLTGLGLANKLTTAGSVPNRVLTAMSQQPGMQVAASTVGGGVGEATDNPLLGLGAAVATPVVAALARRAITPFPSRLTPEAERLAKVAGQEGIDLSPGQRTGSSFLRTTESVLGNMPFSENIMAKGQQNTRDAFNKAVLKRAGITGTSADPATLATQRANIGQQFQDISSRTMVNLDDQFQQDLQRILGRYQAKLPATQKSSIPALVNDLTNTPNLSGEVYQETRSFLKGQADSLRNSDYATSNALRDIRSLLDKAMERSVSPADATAWRQANRQYANLRLIERSMQGQASGSGNIPPSALKGAVINSLPPGGYARGQGELNDLSRIGTEFVRDQIPNSGTPQRSMVMSLLSGAPFIGAGALGATGNPLPAFGMLTLPPAVAAMMTSGPGRAYLGNQLLASPAMVANPAASLLAQQELLRLQKAASSGGR